MFLSVVHTINFWVETKYFRMRLFVNKGINRKHKFYISNIRFKYKFKTEV